MKKYNLIFLLMLAVFSFVNARGQNQSQPEISVEGNGKNSRAEVLERLGLTAEQMQQFRRVNAEQRPQLRAAQQRLKEANRALDEAIYADAPDEATIQTRIKEAQAAQAEVIRVRSLNELAVRRILTVEQLARFREARRRFEAAVEERRLNKKENRMVNAPARRLGNRRGRQPAAEVPDN